MENRDRILEEFGQNVVRDAGIELGARQKRTSYRSTWKGGRPTSTIKRVRRYISTNTGELRRSLRYEVVEIMGSKLVVFYAEEYWYWVNFGRKGKIEKPENKSPKPQIILDWVKSKPILPQKGGGKGFAKRKGFDYNALAFLINRSMSYYGTDGTRFFSKTTDIYLEKLAEDLPKEIAKDIAQSLSKLPARN